MCKKMCYSEEYGSIWYENSTKEIEIMTIHTLDIKNPPIIKKRGFLLKWQKQGEKWW